jgi:hypothetical protein
MLYQNIVGVERVQDTLQVNHSCPIYYRRPFPKQAAFPLDNKGKQNGSLHERNQQPAPSQRQHYFDITFLTYFIAFNIVNWHARCNSQLLKSQ